MAGDDFERELDRFEVDRLVKQLAAKRKGLPEPPPAPASGRVPSAFVPFGSPTAVPAPPTPPASQPMTPAAARSRRWSTNRLLMPTFAGSNGRKSFAFASTLHMPSLRSMSLPALPRIAFPILSEDQWAVIAARMFVGLGVVLGVAMVYWPYSHEHSWGLALYLFATALIVITGVWGSKLTWDSRLGRSHAIAIATVIWGLTLAVVAVLPHLGFGLG